ncbi:MAG: type II toxin-antitoxin system RelE/ParE family toxin [Candidatus Hydrogenedentes bacterium]|nr:type II toxin-antitoxin system RelE/ParE family toxin [Candidatus Hydrogenedentota bacterium]
MGHVRYTFLAETDLEDIWFYIARDDRRAADRAVIAIDAECVRFSDVPDAGRARQDIGEGVRHVAWGRYVIYYRRIEGGIQVLRILHSARDITTDLFELE